MSRNKRKGSGHGPAIAESQTSMGVAASEDSVNPVGSGTDKAQQVSTQGKHGRQDRQPRQNRSAGKIEQVNQATSGGQKGQSASWRHMKGISNPAVPDVSVALPSMNQTGEFNPGSFSDVTNTVVRPSGISGAEPLRPAYLTAYDLDEVWGLVMTNVARAMVQGIRRRRDYFESIPDVISEWDSVLRKALRGLFMVRSIAAIHGISLDMDYKGQGIVLARPWETARLKGIIETLNTILQQIRMPKLADELITAFVQPFKASNSVSGLNVSYYAKVSAAVLSAKMDKYYMVDELTDLVNDLTLSAAGLISLVNSENIDVPYPVGVAAYEPIKVIANEDNSSVAAAHLFRLNYPVPVPALVDNCGEIDDMVINDADYQAAYVFAPGRVPPEAILYGVYSSWAKTGRVALFTPTGFSAQGWSSTFENFTGKASKTTNVLSVVTYNTDPTGSRLPIQPNDLNLWTSVMTVANARYDNIPGCVYTRVQSGRITAKFGPNIYQQNFTVSLRHLDLIVNMMGHEWTYSDADLNGFRGRFERAILQVFGLWERSI